MFITIRQGIVRRQESIRFLTKTGNKVSLNANTSPTIITLADGNDDYIYTELESIPNAWSGPFAARTDYWLYWDIDKTTAKRTFGHTQIQPSFGRTRPLLPKKDEHFFDTTVNEMLVWNGSNWVKRLRVFAGSLNSGKLELETEGSQIKLQQTRNAGEILFDEDSLPILRNNGKFVTSETLIHASDNTSNFYKLELRHVRARAVENIPKYHAVTWKGASVIGVAKQTDPANGECIGVAVENILKDDIKKFTTHGYLINEAWDFSEPAGSPLFVGSGGEITTTSSNSISQQRVGEVINPNTAFINIRPLLKIGGPIVTPTPSPS